MALKQINLTKNPDITQPELDARITAGQYGATTTTADIVLNSDWNALVSSADVSDFTAGSVVFSNGTSLAEDNANLFWDDTNKKLVLSTASFGALKDYIALKNSSGFDEVSFSQGIISGYGGVIGVKDGTGGSDYVRLEYNGGYPQLKTSANNFTFLTSAGRLTFASTYISAKIGAVDYYIASSAGAANTFLNSGATQQVLVAKGFAAQTANLTEWQDSAGTGLSAFNKDGWLGIGTVSPQSPLSFPGTAGRRIDLFGNNTYFIDITSGKGLDLRGDSVTIRHNGFADAAISLEGTTTVATLSAAGKPLTVKGAAAQTANLTEWQNSSGTALSAFDSAGKLGVGTGTPTYQLDVNSGGVRIRPVTSSNAGMTIIDDTSSNAYIQLNDSAGNAAVYFTARSGFNSYITSGNLGIGTTSPAYKIHVVGSSSTESSMGQRRAESSAYGPYQFFEKARGTAASPLAVVANDLLGGPLFYYHNGGTYVNACSIQGYMTSATTAGLAFFTTSFSSVSQAKVVITNGGLVGIGDTTPDAQLDVQVSSAATKGLIVQAAASQTANIIEVQDSAGSTRVMVDSSGRLGLGQAPSTYGKHLAILGNGMSIQGTSFTNGSNVIDMYANSVTGTLGIIGASISCTGSLAMDIFNTNTSTGSARFKLMIGAGNTAGDCHTEYHINGGTVWSTGLDNSDSDSFKISKNVGLGTNDYLTILTGGNVGIGTTSPGAQLQVTSSAAGTIGSIFKAASAQTANLTEWQNSAGTALAIVNATGAGRFVGTSGAVGAVGGVTYGLSVQNNNNNSWIEILNNGGSGKGAFFGVSANEFELWNWQGGNINFYTATAASSGIKRFIISSTGLVSIGPTAGVGQFNVQVGAAGTVGATIKAAAAQTASLTEWQNSAGTVLASVDATGKFQLPAGTAGAPSVRFGTDTNTGFWQPAANQIGVTVNGTDTFRFATGGLVYCFATTFQVYNTLLFGSSGGPRLSNSSGSLQLRNNANTAYGQLLLGNLIATIPSAGTVGSIVQAAVSQTANLSEWQDSSGTVLASVDASGNLTAANFDPRRSIQLVVTDFTTNTTTGNGQAYFHIDSSLAGKNLVDVHAQVITAGTTGTTDIQIHNVTQAADMLTTKITIDSTETGSHTAATPAVIDTGNDDVAENDLIRIDIDAISTTPAQGLIITLGFE